MTSPAVALQLFRARAAAPPRLTLFVPANKFNQILVRSVLGALFATPLYGDEGAWIGIGLLLFIFASWHSMAATSRVPWLPGAIVAISTLQWVVAPWAAYHLPAIPLAGTMSVPADEYFAFAVPATLALAVGVYLPLWRVGMTGVLRKRGPLDVARLVRNCDVMVLVGLGVRFFVAPFVPGEARYFATLIGQLAYVGAFGLMLLGGRGWQSRILVVFALEALIDSVDGVYNALVTWSVHFALLYAFTHKIRRTRLIVLGSAALTGVLAMNGFKGDFRDEIAVGNLTVIQRGALAGASFIDMLRNPSRIFSKNNLSFNISRLNQGITISRVLYWTPSREPFAGGETISAAVMAAALPRVLDPNKTIAGGFVNYPRFTGRTLVGSTSINLSVPGELYANYGRWGAAAGMFVVGMLLGLIFRMFVRWSRASILWWAWASYVLFSVVGAESGMAETLNQVVKSGIIMVVVIRTVPMWVALRKFATHRRGIARPLKSIAAA